MFEPWEGAYPECHRICFQYLGIWRSGELIDPDYDVIWGAEIWYAVKNLANSVIFKSVATLAPSQTVDQ